MFKRAIYNKLIEWKKRKNRKPLVLRGARQVGKTTVVEQFSNEFKQYIYLNLENINDRKIFDKNENFETIIDAIFFNSNAIKNERDTLIFIDEIQTSPNAIKTLRYFYEKTPDYFVIAAISLLETVINNKINFPVGRVEYLLLRPVSFIEFLTALDEQNAIEAFETIPLPEYAHEKLNNLFKIYTLIGGMPEIVASYLENRDLTIVKNIHGNLLISILDDVEKYSKSLDNKNIIRHVIRNSFPKVNSRIKFQGFGNSNYGSREIGETFRILEKTFILNLLYPITDISLPLIPNKRKSPRLYLLDTGMANFANKIQMEIFNSNNLGEAYRGKIAEHIVGQELIANNYSPLAQNNFWVREKKQSSAEIDYLIVWKNKIIPIEVKSGAEGKLRSLNQFIDITKNNIAIRFYDSELKINKATTNGGNKFTLINLPHFLAGQVEKYLTWTTIS